MATPSIAHFGTTIVESAPPEGSNQAEVPITGALRDTLRFLEIFGFEPLMENFYPNMGRQYIWRRGDPADADYIEKDNFTSYRAEQRPHGVEPRVGDTIFRMTHRDPLGVWQAWQAEGLGEALLDAALEEFVQGKASWLLLRGPDGQVYELGPTQADAASNHCVYVWTAPDAVVAAADAYCGHFGLERGEVRDFHGLGQVQMLHRESPGVTVGLVYAAQVAERWSDDIFLEAGYSHFRLGALDMARTQQETREAFPQGGDVAFVYFEDSYLELVQAR
jgi:hypothetical protein